MSRFKNHMLGAIVTLLCLMVAIVLLSTLAVQKSVTSREGYLSPVDKDEIRNIIGNYADYLYDWGEIETASASDAEDSYVTVYIKEVGRGLMPYLLDRDGTVIKDLELGTRITATDSFFIMSDYTQDEELAKVCSMKEIIANDYDMVENPIICDYFVISPDGDYLILRTGWGESKEMKVYNRDMEEIWSQELPVRDVLNDGYVYDNFFFPEAYVPGHLLFQDRSDWNLGPQIPKDINLVNGEVRTLEDREFEREDFLKLTDEEMAAYLEEGYCIYPVVHALDFRDFALEQDKYLVAKHHKELGELGLRTELLDALLRCEDAQLMSRDFVLVNLGDEAALIKLGEASYE